MSMGIDPDTDDGAWDLIPFEPERQQIYPQPVPPRAEEWKLQTRGDDWNGLDGYMFVVERTLSRQTGGLWFLYERGIHAEAEVESWRKTTVISAAEAASLLVEDGLLIPADLVPIVQAQAAERVEQPSDTPLIVPGIPDGEVPLPPWTDQDLDAIQVIPRKLLTYLWARRAASLSEVCPAVWGRTRARVTDNAVKAANRKANQFLARNAREAISRDGEKLDLK
jgi:hypothetical protein